VNTYDLEAPASSLAKLELRLRGSQAGAWEPEKGVANLVLACTDCNRGVNGKFAHLPALPLLQRLHDRNEYLFTSHHPLRETLGDFCERTYPLDESNRLLDWENPTFNG